MHCHIGLMHIMHRKFHAQHVNVSHVGVSLWLVSEWGAHGKGGGTVQLCCIVPCNSWGQQWLCLTLILWVAATTTVAPFPCANTHKNLSRGRKAQHMQQWIFQALVGQRFLPGKGLGLQFPVGRSCSAHHASCGWSCWQFLSFCTKQLQGVDLNQACWAEKGGL